MNKLRELLAERKRIEDAHRGRPAEPEFECGHICLRLMAGAVDHPRLMAGAVDHPRLIAGAIDHPIGRVKILNPNIGIPECDLKKLRDFLIEWIGPPAAGRTAVNEHEQRILDAVQRGHGQRIAYIVAMETVEDGRIGRVFEADAEAIVTADDLELCILRHGDVPCAFRDDVAAIEGKLRAAGVTDAAIGRVRA